MEPIREVFRTRDDAAAFVQSLEKLILPTGAIWLTWDPDVPNLLVYKGCASQPVKRELLPWTEGRTMTLLLRRLRACQQIGAGRDPAYDAYNYEGTPQAKENYTEDSAELCRKIRRRLYEAGTSLPPSRRELEWWVRRLRETGFSAGLEKDGRVVWVRRFNYSPLRFRLTAPVEWSAFLISLSDLLAQSPLTLRDDGARAAADQLLDELGQLAEEIVNGGFYAPES